MPSDGDKESEGQGFPHDDRPPDDRPHEDRPHDDRPPEDWPHLIGAVAARRDRAAFARLFAHFAPLTKAFLRRSGLSESMADELAQETLLLVWRKAALFDPETAGAAAWIFAIARNVRISAHRRGLAGALAELPDVDASFQADDSPGPEARFAAAQSDRRVRAALGKLSDAQRRVLELSFFEEKAHGDIARILQIPLGTVKSRARLAMSRLRELLDEFS